MKQHLITVTFDKGQTRCDPLRLTVGPGDTVRWKCETGALAMDFGPNQPFTTVQVWTAAAGNPTTDAVVRSDLRAGTVFRPTICIDDRVVAQSLGDIIFQRA